MANNYKVKMKDIQNKYKFKIFCAGYEYDDTEIKQDILELQGDVSDLEIAMPQKALISETGRYIELELNSSTYVLTAKLYDKNNNLISSSTPIDLPLESMIVNATYDSTTKSLIITLQNGNTTSIPLGDLISGLEATSNKVTSLSSSSTDVQYPSAKCVYDSQVAQDTIIEGLDNELDATKNELEATKEELNQYKTIYNVLPKVNGSGESITLDNTGESILKLDLKGNTSQDSTTGKNTLPNNLTTQTKNGLTLTKNEDGTCLVSGTATADTTFRVEGNDLINYTSGNYIVNGCPSGGNSSTYSLLIGYYNESGAYQTQNYETGSGIALLTTYPKYAISIFVRNGVSANNLLFKPMVRLSSISDDTYEPYTNGASPNPDYPQRVKVVSGDNEIVVSNSDNTQSTSYPIHLGEHWLGWIGDYKDGFIRNSGKNVINIKYKNNVMDLVVGRDLTNTEINLDLTSAVGKIYITTGGYFKAGTYTLTNYSATYLSINRIAIAGTTCANSSEHLRNSYTWTQSVDGYTYFGLEGDAGESSYTDTPIANELFIMINEGSTALPYEPYGNGDWYLEKHIGKVVLDGSEAGWDQGSVGATYTNFQFKIDDIEAYTDTSKTPNNYINYFTPISYSSNWYPGSMSRMINNLKVYFITEPTQTLAGWKTWLSTHNTIVYYVLATPYLSLIENETLISQLDKVEKALGKDGQTNISQVNNDAPFKIYASALEKISNS